MSEKSVGLIVLTEIPGMGLCAVLRERGYFNFEKMQPESWPGACQVTVHGRIEGEESFHLAICREMKEELGEKFTHSSPRAVIYEALRFQKGNKEVVTFALKVDFALLKEIRLSPESGSILFLRQNEIDDIVNITLFDKAEGVPSRKTIAMFPDEKEAVIKAFALFS
ncbi:MAG: NUDIX hydrolase [bacterium]|nr:NUDIX hydrolase [bacterium]